MLFLLKKITLYSWYVGNTIFFIVGRLPSWDEISSHLHVNTLYVTLVSLMWRMFVVKNMQQMHGWWKPRRTILRQRDWECVYM